MTDDNDGRLQGMEHLRMSDDYIGPDAEMVRRIIRERNAENARLRSQLVSDIHAETEIDRLETENEQLELEVAAWKQASDLKAKKIERLQSALLAIADHDDPDEMSAMARGALEGGKMNDDHDVTASELMRSKEPADVNEARDFVEACAVLQAENERLRAQLPDRMKHCTILFKECPVGHGRLTATNWIDRGCEYCEIERLRAALLELKGVAENNAVLLPEKVAEFCRQALEIHHAP